MDLNDRLVRLEQRVERHLRAKAKADDYWQFRYEWWCKDGLDGMPPPTQPLTLEEFKAAWFRVFGPMSRSQAA
jgi:hypothetical protein